MKSVTGTQVCEEVRQETPTDEQILNTMTIVYRRANCMDLMSAAFAAASAAHPKDEGLLRGVFISCVRQAPFQRRCVCNALSQDIHLGIPTTVVHDLLLS